jgi:hypothetical protein
MGTFLAGVIVGVVVALSPKIIAWVRTTFGV